MSAHQNRKLELTDEAKKLVNKPVDLDAYLKSLALKRKVTVEIMRAKSDVVKLWNHTHWSQLDPY